MRTLIRLLNGRHLQRQWVRSLLSLVGVAVGVGTFVFAPALTGTIVGAVDLTQNDLSGRAIIEVRSASGTVEVAALESIRSITGVRLATPFLQYGGWVRGQPEVLVIVGIDPQHDLQVRDYPLEVGTFLTGTGGVLVGANYTRDKKLRVGDTLQVISVGGVLDLTVRGLLSGAEGFGRLNGGDLLVVDIQDAFRLRGGAQADTISILTDPALSTDEVMTSLRTTLGDAFLIESPTQRFQGTRQFTVVLSLILSIVCSLILGVGVVLIYNSMAISVAQRRAEIGVLRAVGASRAEVRTLYLLEATVLGALGSAAGILLGYGMVAVGKNLPVIPEFTQSTILSSRGQVSVPDGLWLIAFIGGTIISAAAGYLPARAASRVDPIEAMLQIRAETGNLRFSLRQTLLAVTLIGIPLLGMVVIPAGTLEGIIFGNSAIYLVLAGMILLVAPLMSLLAHGLPSFLYRVSGVVGLIAADNVMRRPKRMLITASFVMFGCTMILQVSGTNFGFQGYVQEWTEGENLGDLILLGPTRDPLHPAQPIPADVVEAITQRSEIAGFYTERHRVLEQNGLTFLIRAMDMAEFQALGGHFPWATGDQSTAYTRLADLQQPAALTSGSLISTANGIAAGKQTTLKTPSGTYTLDIVGAVLGVIETDRVVLVINRKWYVDQWNDPSVDRVTLKVRPGVDVNALRRELLSAYALRGVMVLDASEMRAAFMKMILTISTVSQLLSLLFALTFLAGLAGTLVIMVIDRRRELDMMRAVGMLRRQIVVGILFEAIILILFGLVIAVPGVSLTTALQRLSMESVMGIRFTLDPKEILIMAGLALLIGLAAAYFPAQSAGRTDVLEAMRYE